MATNWARNTDVCLGIEFIMALRRRANQSLKWFCSKNESWLLDHRQCRIDLSSYKLPLFHKQEVWSKKNVKVVQRLWQQHWEDFWKVLPGIVDTCQNMCQGGYSTLKMTPKVTDEVFAEQTRIWAITHDPSCSNFVNVCSWNFGFSRPWFFFPFFYQTIRMKYTIFSLFQP
jgi:hypothetical protein